MPSNRTEHLCIHDFPCLYDDVVIDTGLTSAPINIDEKRQEKEKKDKTILFENSANCAVDDFVIKEGQHRYSIESNGVVFETLFIDNPKSDILYVSLTCAAHDSYPIFMRWSWHTFLDAKMLCIDDPSYENYKLRYTRWFYGTKEKSYLQSMIPVIQKYIEQLHIERNNVIFLGSSGGGYAALYLANAMHGTNAFALNPQIMPGRWRKGKFIPQYKKNGIDLLGEDIHHRNNLVLNAPDSKFFIVYNMLSPDDVPQLNLLCANQHIMPNDLCYGIRQHQNIILWLHASAGARPHGCNPERIELKILEFLLIQTHYGATINDFTKISQVINEYMNIKYSLRKANEQISKQRQREREAHELALTKAKNEAEANAGNAEQWQKKYRQSQRSLAKAKSNAEANALKIQQITSSVSYKIGRAITWPFRLGMRRWKRIMGKNKRKKYS